MKYAEFKNNKTFNDISDKISDVLLKGMDELSLFKKHHLISRLKKAYPERNLGDFQKAANKGLLELIENRYEKYVNFNIEKEYQEYVKYNNGLSKFKESIERSLFFVKSNEEALKFLSYSDLIESISMCERENLIIDDKYYILVNKDWEKLAKIVLNNPDYLINLPVDTVNHFYYYLTLKRGINYVNFKPYEDKLFHLIKTSFNHNDHIDYISFLYSMTHIPIVLSHFYKSKIYDINYRWILDYFIKNKNKIFETKHMDIIIEIGVVLRLFNYYDVEDYKIYVKNNINNKGYLTYNKSDSINKVEHTNILAILLIKGF